MHKHTLDLKRLISKLDLGQVCKTGRAGYLPLRIFEEPPVPV